MMSHKSHKASLACAGAFAAAASLAGIGPALSHVIVGNRVFPATLEIDDPGVNDELTLPTVHLDLEQSGQFARATHFNGFYRQKGSPPIWRSSNRQLVHLTNTVKPNGTIGTLNGWGNIETQLEYQLYVNPEHEFIVSTAVSVEWGHTGDVGIGFRSIYDHLRKGFS